MATANSMPIIIIKKSSRINSPDQFMVAFEKA